MNKKNKQLLILLFLVIFGAVIRLFRFPNVPASLFSDEVDIGYQVMSFKETGRDYFGNSFPLQFRSFSDVRTSLPIYATILVSYIPSVNLELAIRLTPLFFSLGSLVLIHFFINSFFDNFKLDGLNRTLTPGHFAVFLLSLAPWHFTYSRTAFELSQLFFTVILGLHLFLCYLKSGSAKTLVSSLLALGFTPMIYSTAKFSIIGYLFVFWFLSTKNKRKQMFSQWYIFPILFVPLVAIFINGGAGQRFREIAIFTDPTISSEVNYRRQLDLGSNLVVGSSPNLATRIIHNKVTLVTGRFIRNSLISISSNFLFIAGDTNTRHAVSGWGMFTKSYLIFVLMGVYILARDRQKKLISILVMLVLIAVIPSALTRDGGDHGSRLFMLILPIIIVSTIGIVGLSRFRKVLLLANLLLLAESSFYFHDYFLHYPYDSDKQFHIGMKEVVKRNTIGNEAIIISPKYEPPLIFYLFYNHFSPAKFQQLISDNKLYGSIDPDINLEGYRLGEEDVYFANVRNYNAKPLLPMRGNYYVTPIEAAAIFGDRLNKISPEIKSMSGLAIFYRLTVN